MRLVGILHDVLEDTTASLQDIYNLFEFGDDRIANEVLGAVDAMTRRKDENYLDFILRVKANPIALEVKLADLEDNMRDLPEGTRKDKYRLAHYVLKQQPKEIVHGDLTSES
jgi:(p)ppGpp synthase/HD superfamily hydrolase